MVIAAHPEHRDVQQHADGDPDASKGESPDSASVEKNLSVDHLRLRGSILFGDCLLFAPNSATFNQVKIKSIAPLMLPML